MHCIAKYGSTNLTSWGQIDPLSLMDRPRKTSEVVFNTKIVFFQTAFLHAFCCYISRYKVDYFNCSCFYWIEV